MYLPLTYEFSPLLKEAVKQEKYLLHKYIAVLPT